MRVKLLFFMNVLFFASHFCMKNCGLFPQNQETFAFPEICHLIENERLCNGASGHRKDAGGGGGGRAVGGAERCQTQVRDPAHALAFCSGAAQGPGSARAPTLTYAAGTGQGQALGILSVSPACRRQRIAARNAATRTSWSPSTTR